MRFTATPLLMWIGAKRIAATSTASGLVRVLRDPLILQPIFAEV
jgi:hypothetical protein